MKKEFQNRKHPRLDLFDYGSSGAYFVTICTQDRQRVLSNIVPAENVTVNVEYTKFGKIAEKQLFLLEERFANLSVDKYEIMPDHIHIILMLKEAGDGLNIRDAGDEINIKEAGASPRPTIMDIVCAFKSLTARECRNAGFEGKLFQTSFYEHIIRNETDYQNTLKYIYENPYKWIKAEDFK